MIIGPITWPPGGRLVDKPVVAADYFKTSFEDLVLGYRSSDLVSLNLGFARLSPVVPRSTIKDDEPAA